MNDPTPNRRLISRVGIRSYRNIAACDVELNQLSFLVGPNGSGKSNFLDALGLVGESLRSSLASAVRKRGGVGEIVRRTTRRARYFGIRLDYSLKDIAGHYAVAVGLGGDGGIDVRREECRRVGPEGVHFCRVEKGQVTECTFPHPPPVAPDNLYLIRLAAVPEFHPICQALSEMCVYRLDPGVIRGLHEAEAGPLREDGRNLASVVDKIKRQSPTTKERIDLYLQAVVPELVAVDRLTMGPKQTLAFRKMVREGTQHRRFFASDMSDGTLRVVGMLAALLQRAAHDGSRRGLVGIEEPETALHPGALDVLFDILADGADRTQVIASSQSADLLDHKDIRADSIIAVASGEGGGRFGPIDEVGRSAIAKGAFTVGELMRAEQLLPDENASRLRPSQVPLFGPAPSR